ncbi:MAG: beta-galactosidase [Limisphaerales bacterium]
MKRRLVLKHVGAATLGLVPVLAIAVASCWLAGCGGFARPTPAGAPVAVSAKVTDLRPLWDAERVLHNPCKGWYHHYYDNGTRNYRLSSDDDLDQFPGMDHLYIRLSWSHFEPQEGHYNWSWIDEVKDHWTAKGYGISLRISTCETGEAHATPEWVIAAGAKGAMYKAYGREVWVPEYDDPIFLSKLDRFVGELARRYDGQPWLRYVDIGLGTWGEGHNHPMFDKAIPMGAVKKHVDIYSARFRRSVLVLSDDAVHVHGRKPDEEKELREYAAARGISWRDDSILTWPGLHNWPDRFNVARPELFESAWRKFPTVLETSHYHEALRDGAYKPTPSGSIRAYDDLRGAIGLTHATYLGDHH